MKITKEFIELIPKTDLHLHLDGSIRLSTLIQLANERDIALPAYTEKELKQKVFKDKYENLEAYLEGFQYINKVLQSETALERLAATIKARREASAETSYTKRLLSEPLKPAKKLGEEGVEVALAAVSEDKAALISETADLLYHLLVVLESRDVTLEEVYAELEHRMAEAKKRKAASVD